MAGSERDGTGNGLSGTAAENNEGGTSVESQPKRTRKYAKLVAAVVSLLLLGVMASGALAEGDPFSPLAALTGSTTTTSSTTADATGAAFTTPDTTGAPTTAATTTAAATTTTAATTPAATTTA